jgi:hypothetical protein
MGIVTDKVIIIEDVLEKVFSYLPKMSFEEGGTEYPVVFGYGDKIELNSFLSNREQSDVYPLIWLLYPLSEEHHKTKANFTDVVFVLAVTTNQSMENKERLILTYGKVLMPLFYNIRMLFRRSNVISVDSKNETYKATKFPNYSEDETRDKSGTIAIWDALQVIVDLEIIQGCIKPIKF